VNGLSAEEVTALADAFPDPDSTRRVLQAAGLKVRHHPVWNVRDAESVWYEVATLVTNGRLVGGREAMLAAARAEFPNNEIFAGDCPPPARGKKEATGQRGVPTRGDQVGTATCEWVTTLERLGSGGDRAGTGSCGRHDRGGPDERLGAWRLRAG